VAALNNKSHVAATIILEDVTLRLRRESGALCRTVTGTNFMYSTPESMCSSAAAQSIIAPEDVSDTINTSPCRLLIGPRDKVLCCTLAIHKNKGMNMDDQQEFMHKLMFERRGKLPDRTIVSIVFTHPSCPLPHAANPHYPYGLP